MVVLCVVFLTQFFFAPAGCHKIDPSLGLRLRLVAAIPGGLILTPDGRYAVFASRANNLALGSNGVYLPSVPPKVNVFLRDRASATTILVSVDVAGTAGGNGDSFPTAISTNGQFILFESTAGNLVTNDANNASDVFHC